MRRIDHPLSMIAYCFIVTPTNLGYPASFQRFHPKCLRSTKLPGKICCKASFRYQTAGSFQGSKHPAVSSSEYPIGSKQAGQLVRLFHQSNSITQYGSSRLFETAFVPWPVTPIMFGRRNMIEAILTGSAPTIHSNNST